MDVTERFAALVACPEAALRLDEAALLIAAHAYPSLDVGAQLARLDDLAERCPTPTLDGLVAHLFVDLGFRGNRHAYYDPRNSFLNDVLDRRLGIPITLSVLTMSIGARVGVPMAPVGMPGHFLLRDRVDDSVFVDPFAGGAVLDADGCRAAFTAVHGDSVPFDPAFLEPVGARAVVSRMLANLRSIAAATGDRSFVLWVVRLRALLPGASPDEQAELAGALAAVGRFSEAAANYEAVSARVDGELAAGYRASAARLRARLN